MQFAAWIRTAPTLHTSLVRELHCAYCSAPCYGWRDHMVYNHVAIVAGTLMGIRAVLRNLLHEGRGVLYADTMGARVYDRHGTEM